MRLKSWRSKILRSYFFPFNYPGKPASAGVLVVTPMLVCSWLLCRLSRAMDDRLLKIDWQIQPVKSVSLTPTTRGDLAEMAIGTRSSGGNVLRASRILKRLNMELRGIAVYWQLDSEDSCTQGLINYAEDPRIFEFRGELWIHYQIRNEESGDYDTYMFNPREKVTIKLLVTENFQGKNWSAFEYQNDLYFIYSFSPFKLYKALLSNFHKNSTTLLSCIDLDMKIVNSLTRPDQAMTGIGAIRGGTPMLEVESAVFVGFTHVNLGDQFEKSHHIGFVELDLNNRTIIFRDVTQSRLNLLSAPYCVELLKEGQIAVNYNCSTGSVHNLFQPITNKRSTFLLRDLRKI